MTKRIEINCRPLEGWPRPFTENRPRAPFSATYTSTMSLLKRELKRIIDPDQPHVSIQLAITSGDIRNDGQPRASARPEHPGVALGFESIYGPLRYYADPFIAPNYGPGAGTPAWQHNLRAIALGLEALRKVDRYGVSNDGAQYRGWAELPSGSGVETHMTSDMAAKFIAEHAGGVGVSAIYDDVDLFYRIAAKTLHPDAGGDVAMFQRLQGARDIVKRRS